MAIEIFSTPIFSTPIIGGVANMICLQFCQSERYFDEIWGRGTKTCELSMSKSFFPWWHT